MTRSRIGHRLYSEGGRDLLASILNTTSVDIFDRHSGRQRIPDWPQFDGVGLHVFSLNPHETLVLNWSHAISDDAKPADALHIGSQAMHDENGDREISDDETAITDLLVTVASPTSGFSVHQAAISATGDTVFLPGSLVDFFILVKNHTTERATDVVLSLYLPVGITYVPNSAAYTFGESLGPNARAGDLSPGSGLSVSDLEAGEEWILSYQGIVNADAVRVGDELTIRATVHSDESSRASDVLTLPVSGRADLEVSVEGPTEAGPGDEVSFSVLLRNQGDVTLEEGTFAVDLGCGMDVVDSSSWVHTWFRSPVRGGLGYSIPSSDLGEYLAHPDRKEPFRLNTEIEPGEVIEISFKMKLDEDMPLGTVLTPTFHAVGRSTDGYQLESAKHVLAVGNEAATAADVEAARQQLNEALENEVDRLEDAIGQPSLQTGDDPTSLWEAIENVESNVEANKSLIEQLLDWEWFGLEIGAALIGGLVGLMLGYFFRGPIARLLGRLPWPRTGPERKLPPPPTWPRPGRS